MHSSSKGKKRGYPFPPLAEFVTSVKEIQSERKDIYFRPLLTSAFSPFELIMRFRRVMHQILLPIATSKQHEDKRKFLEEYLTRNKLEENEEVLISNQNTIFSDSAEKSLNFPVNDREFKFSQVNPVGPVTYEEGVLLALQLLQLHFGFNFVDLYQDYSLLIDHLVIDQEQHWNFSNVDLPPDMMVLPERMHIVNLQEEYLDSKQLSEQLSSLGVWHMLTWCRREVPEDSQDSPLEQICMIVVVHTSDPESEIQKRKEATKGIRNVQDEKLQMTHIHAAFIPQINLKRELETGHITDLSKYVPVSTHHIYILP